MLHQTRQLILILLACGWALSANAASIRVNDKQIAEFPKDRSVVVMNFWATWCEPCVEEIPIFVKLHKQYPDVEFVGISMDELSMEQNVQEFAEKHSMKYRIVLRDGQDFESMVNSIDPDWMGGLPATFVFRDGKRVFSKAGPIKEKELSEALKGVKP